MPENEFEKKVSSELQGLRLKPSDVVWQKVEERIRRKKRRKVFFILFFAGLALLGWWQWDNFFGEKKTVLVKTETPAEKKETPVEKTGTLSLPENNMEAEPLLPTVKNESPVLPETGKEKLSAAKEILTIKEPSQGKKIAATGKEKQKPVSAEKVSAVKEKPVSPNLPVVKSETEKQNQVLTKKDEEVKKVLVEEKEAVKIEPIPADTVVVKAVKETKEEQKIEAQEKAETPKADPLVQNEMKTDTAAVIPPVQPLARIKKWKWGVHISPGISMMNENFFSFNLQKSAELSSGTGSPGSGAGNRPVPPSESKAGFAIRLGGFMQRNISSQNSFSFGLQYGYYSDRTRIGSSRDSLRNYSNQLAGLQDASFVYNAGRDTAKFYTNRYHFIELPLRFRWRLNKNENYPLSWDVGLSISRLIAAKALVYDTSFGGIYYNSNKFLNKTQFSLSTGFSCTLISKSHVQWTIGPLADIHVNSLLNNPLEKKKYLLFTGIKTSVSFSSKK